MLCTPTPLPSAPHTSAGLFQVDPPAEDITAQVVRVTLSPEHLRPEAFTKRCLGCGQRGNHPVTRALVSHPSRPWWTLFAVVVLTPLVLVLVFGAFVGGLIAAHAIGFTHGAPAMVGGVFALMMGAVAIGGSTWWHRVRASVFPLRICKPCRRRGRTMTLKQVGLTAALLASPGLALAMMKAVAAGQPVPLPLILLVAAGAVGLAFGLLARRIYEAEACRVEVIPSLGSPLIIQGGAMLAGVLVEEHPELVVRVRTCRRLWWRDGSPPLPSLR